MKEAATNAQRAVAHAEQQGGATRRAPGEAQGKKKTLPLGLRWPVERTNSWLSNFGGLRRNTDRFIAQRLAQLALAITLVITVKLVKWAERWQPVPA